jgi:hypothetical protein
MLTLACISVVSGCLGGAATITVSVPAAACCSDPPPASPSPSHSVFVAKRDDNVEQKLEKISAAVLAFGVVGLVLSLLAWLRAEWRAWANRDRLFTRRPLDERALALQREQLWLQREQARLLGELLAEQRGQRRVE